MKAFHSHRARAVFVPLVVATLALPGAFAQQPAPPTHAPAASRTFSQQDLDQLLAPIAYNSKTGNAAVATTNQNGVTTTQTSRGGEAKSKNGNAVVEGPNGTVCAKGQNQQGCTKK